VYQLPWGKSLHPLAKSFLAGWNISSITTFESGNALTVYNDQTSARDYEPNLPLLTGNPNLSGGSRTVTRYFNTDVFSAPPQDVKGNAGMGIVRGPGMNNWDMAFSKVFQPKERLKVELRAEMFNVFNHTQWRYINTSYSTETGNTFGWTTGAREPRIIQMFLKISF
jgi:hypothetical protein